MKKRTVFSYPYIVWMLIFILAPMLLIIYYAFAKNGTFSFDNIRNVLTNKIYLDVLWRSVWIAVETTVICLALGYPVAYFLSTMKRRTAALLSVAFVVPMWMNFLLRTYAWQVILDSSGILNAFFASVGLPPQRLLYTEGAVLLGTVYNFLPFMILPIYTVLVKMDKSQIEAARDLGANGVTTFLKVVFPLSMPGVFSGISMVFVPALTTFAISRLLGGGMFMLYGDLIENQFILLRDWSTGSAMSFILLILVIISMAVMRRIDREAGEEGGGRLW